jgi:hypothetical protein
MQLTEKRLKDVVRELQKNSIKDAREVFCEKHSFTCDNINNVIVIVPEKYMFNNPYKWIVFDRYIDNITICENKPMNFCF